VRVDRTVDELRVVKSEGILGRVALGLSPRVLLRKASHDRHATGVAAPTVDLVVNRDGADGDNRSARCFRR
jgi:hypothetical protein